MPATLPAHAAAVLPFFRARRWMPPTALVVGACAPDMAYAIRWAGWFSHSLAGVFLFCLPMGLIALVWLEALVLPALRRTLPPACGVQWARFLRTDGVPDSAGTLLRAAIGIVIGTLTHLLWDGFTHRSMWPAQVLYPHVVVPLPGGQLSLARVLQHVSSILGTAIVCAVMARRYRHLPAAPGGSWSAFLPILTPTLAGAAVGLSTRILHFRYLGALEAQLWWMFWPAFSCACLGLTLGCVYAWIRGTGFGEAHAARHEPRLGSGR